MDFAASGLGLRYGTVALVRADERWHDIAAALGEQVELALGVAESVEHVGSTSVPGLLAKPIIDLAIGLRLSATLDDVQDPLEQLGWIYRGDAGDDGGLVFVLEDSPRHRVAHAHAVEFGGAQWVRYLQFRDLLLKDPHARRTYENTKLQMAKRCPDGREGYTAGKAVTVTELLTRA